MPQHCTVPTDAQRAPEAHYLEEMICKRTDELYAMNKLLRNEITNRLRAENIIRQSEARYRALVEQAADGIFILDHSGSILEVNISGCSMLGYSYEELLWMNLNDLIEDDGQECHSIPEGLSRPHLFKTVVREYKLRRKDGSILYVEINAKLLPDGLCQGIVRDITSRRQIEKEMARLDRMNIIGEMAAGIGHEVRNPLTTVRGFLQLLQNKAECQCYNSYFSLMIQELDRANSIISEYLSLAKNKSVQLQQKDLNAIINALYPLIQADGLVSDKYVTLDLLQLPPLKLDEKEIRQLILNLSRNGLEAMDSGHTLMIQTYQEDNSVVLAIQDEGPGIDPKIADQLGTPFFTTKEKGTGLGLAVCYSIVARHNAAMTFETSSAGTTFFVRFPLPSPVK